MNNSSCDEGMILICGSTKCGTTSLFHYLADHPSICRAIEKEIRYFVPKSYYLAGDNCIDSISFDEYKNIFYPDYKAGKHKYRLEATPDYMYCKDSAGEIKKRVKNPKLIFLLRDPVDRFYSWYHFSKQRGLISKNETIETFFSKQKKIEGESSEKYLQCYRALEQGKYEKYLSVFSDLFSEDEMIVLEYDYLKTDPAGLMKNLCEFLEIDSKFYDTYSFEIKNKTEEMRFLWIHKLYIFLIENIREIFYKQPEIIKIFRKVKNIIEPFYMRINAKSINNNDKSFQDIRLRLQKYYKEDK